MRSKFELADAVKLFGAPIAARGKLTPLQLKVLGKISHCRTTALGGHQQACENCGTVRYSYNSCGDRAINKPVTLDGIEFLRRFAMHILPQRFVKITRYCIYNHTTKRNLDLQFVREEKHDIQTLIKQKQPKETSQQRFERITGVDPCLCPACKSGKMVVIRELPRIRSPAFFATKQTQPQY